MKGIGSSTPLKCVNRECLLCITSNADTVRPVLPKRAICGRGNQGGMDRQDSECDNGADTLLVWDPPGTGIRNHQSLPRIR